MLCFNTFIPKFGVLLAFIPSILGAALDDRAIAREAVTSPLKPRTTHPPYTNIFVNDATTAFVEETDGTWQLIDADGNGVPDLAFIQTSDTASGTVEVHIASSASNLFQIRIWDSGSTFAEEIDGAWLLVPSQNGTLPDLAFIKTANTATGRVEVYIASGASGYQTRILETSTVFPEATNGVWSLLDFDGDGILDLAFIGTSNTASGFVEIHVASGALGFQAHTFDAVTAWDEHADVVYSLVPFSPGSNNGDLSLIRTSNDPTGQVTVQVTSRSSGYIDLIVNDSSAFIEETATEGDWSLVDYNGDGLLDLVFIQTKGTKTGLVNVLIASG